MKYRSLSLGALSILFFASSAWSAPVKATPEASETPTACVVREAVDATAPEVRALLANLLSIQPAGEINVRSHENRTVASQDFDVVGDTGQPVKVTVTCASSGCTSPCAVTGCNPTVFNNEPACTPVVCRINGSPCGIQTTCTKTAVAADADTDVEAGEDTIDHP